MKKYIIFILFILFVSFGFIGDRALAAPKLEVSSEVGINGKFKYQLPVPVKITVTNNGSDFSGDLVIDVYENYDVGSAIVYPLTIAEGETKTINLTLNSLEETYNPVGGMQQSIYFYEGGIEKGKSIDYKGSKTFRTLSHDFDTIFLFTLTENSDRLTGLYGLRDSAQYGVEIFHINDLKGYELPTDVRAFQLANILLVDEVSLTDLSQEQQQALYDWVQSGGTLLVGASDHISSSMGIFQSHLPLTLSNERLTVAATSLSQLIKGGKFDQDIKVQKATENKDSKILLKDGDAILAASKKLGNGQIIQTSFSLGDQPLAGMTGYANLLSKILDLQNFNSTVLTNSDYYFYLPSDVGKNNELFPSFEVTIHWLVIIIIIYILVIGPVLYIVLKRMDKREHTWWIIPTIAIFLSVVMFVFGAKDRLLNAQIQQASYLKVNEDKSLEGYYINSLLTNKSGDYQFTTDENTTITTVNENQFGNILFGSANMNKLHQDSYVTQHANGSTLTLRNLKYWSVKSMIGKSTIKNAGNMDINITLLNNKIEGTIKNNFSFTLKDVAIWSGNSQIALGDIKPNETLKVSEKIKSTTLIAPYIPNVVNSTTPTKKEEILTSRLNSLKFGLVNLTTNEALPVVIAWTDEPLIGTKLEGNSKVDAANYLVQTFKPKVQLSGEFTINNDVLSTDVMPFGANNGVYIESVKPNEWRLEKGEYEYYVNIPEELLKQTKSWSELSISKVNKNISEIQIWNDKRKKYEDLSEQNMQITSNVSHYISEGFIKFKFIYDGENFQKLQMPEVTLKGVAK